MSRALWNSRNRATALFSKLIKIDHEVPQVERILLDAWGHPSASCRGVANARPGKWLQNITLKFATRFWKPSTVQIAILSNPWRSRQCTPRSIAAGIYCSAGVWNAALNEPNLQRASIRDCSRSFQGWQVSSRAPSRVCTGSPHDPSNYSCVCMAMRAELAEQGLLPRPVWKLVASERDRGEFGYSSRAASEGICIADLRTRLTPGDQFRPLPVL